MVKVTLPFLQCIISSMVIWVIIPRVAGIETCQKLYKTKLSAISSLRAGDEYQDCTLRHDIEYLTVH